MSNKFKMTLPLVPLDINKVSIVVDGIDLTEKIKEVTIHARAGELTIVTLKFGASVDLEGEAILKLLDYEGKPLGEKEDEH